MFNMIMLYPNQCHIEHKIVNIFLPISFYIYDLGAQKNHLIETEVAHGSVVECLIGDQGAAGSSFTSVTALCP